MKELGLAMRTKAVQQTLENLLGCATSIALKMQSCKGDVAAVHKKFAPITEAIATWDFSKVEFMFSGTPEVDTDAKKLQSSSPLSLLAHPGTMLQFHV